MASHSRTPQQRRLRIALWIAGAVLGLIVAALALFRLVCVVSPGALPEEAAAPKQVALARANWALQAWRGSKPDYRGMVFLRQDDLNALLAAPETSSSEFIRPHIQIQAGGLTLTGYHPMAGGYLPICMTATPLVQNGRLYLAIGSVTAGGIAAPASVQARVERELNAKIQKGIANTRALQSVKACDGYLELDLMASR